MNSEMVFGDYVRERRLQLGLSARELAIELGISAVYVCEMEKNRRCAPVDEKLERLTECLKLTSKEERNYFYDLAAKSKNTVSIDLPDYIMERDIVRAALRTAKECDATDKEWAEFIERIRHRTEAN